MFILFFFFFFNFFRGGGYYKSEGWFWGTKRWIGLEYICEIPKDSFWGWGFSLKVFISLTMVFISSFVWVWVFFSISLYWPQLSYPEFSLLHSDICFLGFQSVFLCPLQVSRCLLVSSLNFLNSLDVFIIVIFILFLEFCTNFSFWGQLLWH